MSVLLPELSSVHLRETADALVVEVELPLATDPSRVTLHVAGDLLTLRVPRSPAHERLPGFHPEAVGV